MTKEEKLELAQKEIAEILDKHGFEISFNIDFPNYKKLPDEILLALSVITKHGFVILFELEEKKKEEK